MRTVPWIGPVGSANYSRQVAAGLGVRRSVPAERLERGGDPPRGEVGGPLGHLVDGEERRLADLALLAHHPVHQRRVVHAAVEDQAERVVPAAPRGQPVGEQQVAGRRP